MTNTLDPPSQLSVIGQRPSSRPSLGNFLKLEIATLISASDLQAISGNSIGRSSRKFATPPALPTENSNIICFAPLASRSWTIDQFLKQFIEEREFEFRLCKLRTKRRAFHSPLLRVFDSGVEEQQKQSDYLAAPPPRV